MGGLENLMRANLSFLLRSGAAAGAIKVGGGLGNYLMFVALAQVTSAREFGLCAADFSVAGLLGVIGSAGQQSAVLRFWPEWTAKGDQGHAARLVGYSMRIACVGQLAIILFAAAVGLTASGLGADPAWAWLGAATGLLAAGLGYSEVLSGFLRARGHVFFALLPKDIVWRAIVLLA